MKLQQCQPPRIILVAVLILILSVGTTAQYKIARAPSKKGGGGKTPKSETKSPSKQFISTQTSSPSVRHTTTSTIPGSPTPNPTSSSISSPISSPTLSPTPNITSSPSPNPTLISTFVSTSGLTFSPTSSPTSSPTPILTHSATKDINSAPTRSPSYYLPETPNIDSVKFEWLKLSKIRVSISLNDGSILAIDENAMEVATTKYFTNFIEYYDDGSLITSFKRASFNVLRQRRNLRSDTSSSHKNIVINTNRGRIRNIEEMLPTAVIEMEGKMEMLSTELPTDVEVMKIQEKAFINEKDRYMKALQNDVVTRPFEMNIQIVKEMESEEIKEGIQKPIKSEFDVSDDDGTNFFRITAVIGGAVLVVSIVGFGYCKWRSRQLYKKKGTKRIILSDDVSNNADDGIMTGRKTVWDTTNDGTTNDILTPSTLATSKSLLSSAGNCFDEYSLDGSCAIGSLPNAGDKFLEGVIKGKCPLTHPNIEEASHGSSAGNSASVFSFSNQYTDATSIAESVMGGLSAASSYFTGAATKHLANKSLTGNSNNEKRASTPVDSTGDERCKDGIEVLIGGNVLESNNKRDIFEELYSPPLCEEDVLLEIEDNSNDESVSTPTEEAFREGTSNTLVDASDGRSESNDRNKDNRSDKIKSTSAKEASCEGTSNTLIYENDGENVKKISTSIKGFHKIKNCNTLVVDDNDGSVEKILKPTQQVRTERTFYSIDEQSTPSAEREEDQQDPCVIDPRSIEEIFPAREADILADLERDDPIYNRNSTQSSLHRVSVATKSSIQLKSNYPIQAQTRDYSYSESTDDDSTSYEGSSSDNSSFAAPKPLQHSFEIAPNDDIPLSPRSKRKLLTGGNISRERMSARIRSLSPPAPNSDNARFHLTRAIKDGVSSTNHAANARRNRLAKERSINKNISTEDEENVAPPTNIGQKLRKKRLKQQKVAASCRKVRVQQGIGERKFAC